jgi:hypothetical protein
MAFTDDGAKELQRSLFAAQFERDGEQILFRADSSGPAIPITEDDYSRFIADFDAYLTRRRWKDEVWFFLPFLAIILLAVSFDISDGPWFYALIFLSVAPFLARGVILERRAFRAPARFLSGRAPVAANLAPDIARTQALRRMPWRFFLFFGAIPVATAIRYKVFDDPFAKDRIFWTAICGLLLTVLTVQGVRKWLLMRDDEMRNL